MTTKKITELTENTSPVGTDLIVMVDDPAGTPATQKMTIASLLGTLSEEVFILTAAQASQVLAHTIRTDRSFIADLDGKIIYNGAGYSYTISGATLTFTAGQAAVIEAGMVLHVIYYY